MFRNEKLLEDTRIDGNSAEMVDRHLKAAEKTGYKLTVKQACSLFGCSRSAYYEWKNQNDSNCTDPQDGMSEEEKEEYRLTQAIHQIIKDRGLIPGQRELTQILKSSGHRVGRRKVRDLMRSMGLVATAARSRSGRLHRNPYKGQNTHEHPACSCQNYVDQFFDRETVRTVILTDITYLFYRNDRRVCYLATFKDGCTKEILGWNVSDKMDVQLIRGAYDMMMEHHDSEFPDKQSNVKVYLHSDQGSQYLSSDFKQLLSGSCFTQSMSRRGNSQDNAPQESFYAIMKSEMEAVKLAESTEQVRTMVNRYLEDYNCLRCQQCLGWLTPSEYYLYKITDIYPLKKYFAIPAEELTSLKERAELLLKQKKERSRKQKEQYARRTKGRDINSFEDRLDRDFSSVQKILNFVKRYYARAEAKIKDLENLAVSIKEAIEWAKDACPGIKEDLLYYENWKEFEVLNYCEKFSDILNLQKVFPKYLPTY